MKKFITFIIIALLAQATYIQAQSNSNYKYHGSYPQYYFVRTVSSHGIIPATSIQVIDKDGRSISYSYPDRGRNKSVQLSTTDSLINSLEMCATCKIVKTKEQADLMYKQITGISPAFLLQKCPAGYGQATYARYERSNATYVSLWTQFSKGCGRTAEHNKLINDYISEFERPGDENLLLELNKAWAAPKIKFVSDSIDKNFEQEKKNEFGIMPGFSARITMDGRLRLISEVALTQVKVIFYTPSVSSFGPHGYKTSKGIDNTRSYPLTQRSGTDFYDIDISGEAYKGKYKLTIITVSAAGKAAQTTIKNRKVPAELKMK